jgi:hypothetical protein
MGLRRGTCQDQYLGSMEEIFADAYEEQRAMSRPWAVHDAATSAFQYSCRRMRSSAHDLAQ